MIQLTEQEYEALKKDSERYRWMRDNKFNSFILNRNDEHACNYVTAKQWIEEYQPDNFKHENPAEIEKMKETNTIWYCMAYPITPIGSVGVYGASLDYVVDEMMASNIVLDVNKL